MTGMKIPMVQTEAEAVFIGRLPVGTVITPELLDNFFAGPPRPSDHPLFKAPTLADVLRRWGLVARKTDQAQP
jgi:hypothetical protein